jgi:AcrR family transcriptional regulator
MAVSAKTVRNQVSRAAQARASGAPRVRLSAEDRRLQIVRTAIELFARKGFTGTTTKEIALASGVNEALIFRHFATKEELYSAIIDYKMNERCLRLHALLDQAVEQKDDRAFFTRLAYEILEAYTQDPNFMRLMFYSALEGHQLSRMVFEKHIAEMFEDLVKYIAGRIKERVWLPVNPRVAARGFVGMVAYHAMVRELFDPEEKLLKLSNKRAASKFTELFLSGVLRGPGEKVK